MKRVFDDIDNCKEIENDYKSPKCSKSSKIRPRSNSLDTYDRIVDYQVKMRCNNDEYFNNLDKSEQMSIIIKERAIYSQFDNTIPLRYRIINSSIDDSIKYTILQKIDQYEAISEENSEYHKLSKWIEGVSRIPFSQYVDFPIKDKSSYLKSVYETLDKTIYGQYKAKTKIVEIMAQWLSNPNGKPQIIALEGPPGVGKTSLIKNGVSVALKRPFAFYALGGASDVTNLEGHSYTYEGAIWGEIVNILMQTKVMNPIIFFDELDKISYSAKGDEINGLLTHITDSTQNNSFQDKYFSGINIDLSRVLFFFSFNNIELINPIVKDRLTIIKFEEYSLRDKIIICKNYVIPEVVNNIGFKLTDIIIDESIIEYLILTYNKSSGIREIKKVIEDIYLKLNLKRYIEVGIKFPYKLTISLVKKLLE